MTGEGPRMLESVNDYNARRRRENAERVAAARRTGVACPCCARELLWQDAVFPIGITYPPSATRSAVCECGLHLELER